MFINWLILILFFLFCRTGSPCEHDGICVNTPGSFACNCTQGFTGPRCETNVNECESHPCQNEGSCLDDPGTFRCVCMPGKYCLYTAFIKLRNSKNKDSDYHSMIYLKTDYKSLITTSTTLSTLSWTWELFFSKFVIGPTLGIYMRSFAHLFCAQSRGSRPMIFLFWAKLPLSLFTLFVVIIY